MLGSNYTGQAYLGQGPAEGTTFILHSVTATVVTSASISFKLLINKILTASVVTVASVTRQYGRSLSASVTALGNVTTSIVLGLNLRRATTKFLNVFRATKPVAGFSYTDKALTPRTTTKRITEA